VVFYLKSILTYITLQHGHMWSSINAYAWCFLRFYLAGNWQTTTTSLKNTDNLAQHSTYNTNIIWPTTNTDTSQLQINFPSPSTNMWLHIWICAKNLTVGPTIVLNHWIKNPVISVFTIHIETVSNIWLSSYWWLPPWLWELALIPGNTVIRGKRYSKMVLFATHTTSTVTFYLNLDFFEKYEKPFNKSRCLGWQILVSFVFITKLKAFIINGDQQSIKSEVQSLCSWWENKNKLTCKEMTSWLDTCNSFTDTNFVHCVSINGHCMNSDSNIRKEVIW
jgi:hypothetical protein